MRFRQRQARAHNSEKRSNEATDCRRDARNPALVLRLSTIIAEAFTKKQMSELLARWLCSLDNETGTAVFLPARFIVFGAHRELLAVADGREPIRGGS